jgi:hypothetical protein
MTFHQSFDPGNRRWHGRLVGVELPAQGVALAGEAAAVEVEVATSVVQGHEFVASLEVVPLEGIHSAGVPEGNVRRYWFWASYHTTAVDIVVVGMLVSQSNDLGE